MNTIKYHLVEHFVVFVIKQNVVPKRSRHDPAHNVSRFAPTFHLVPQGM
jgi:hypothetical protein